MKMKKLEEEVQNKNERLLLSQRAATGAALCIFAEMGTRYVLSKFGVDGNMSEGDYIPALISVPFGFIGAYVGLNHDRIIQYFESRQQSKIDEK